MDIREQCDRCKEKRISQPYTLPFIKNVTCWNRDILVTKYQEVCPFTVFLCNSCAEKIAKRINPEGEEENDKTHICNYGFSASDLADDSFSGRNVYR